MGTQRMTIEEMHAVAKDTTVPQKFLEHAANRADKVLFRSMTSAPGSGDTTWQNYTYADVRSLTARTAAGLQALDVEPGERVMLMMRNRPDFHWLDLGAQFVRATPVSIYNSSSPEELQYLAEHAEARVIIVEDSGFLDRVLEVRDQLPLVEHIFVIEEPVG
ncbi:MAG: AMP-binding protein, partial [Ilumatobacteraceae bacterium]